MPVGANYEYPVDSSDNMSCAVAKADSVVWYANCERNNNEVILKGIDITTHKVVLKNREIAAAVNCNMSSVIFKDSIPIKRIVTDFYLPGFKIELLSSNIKEAISQKKIDDAKIQQTISNYKSMIQKQAEQPRICEVSTSTTKDKLEFSCGRYTKILTKIPT
jgi:hypothetical protein